MISTSQLINYITRIGIMQKSPKSLVLEAFFVLILRRLHGRENSGILEISLYKHLYLIINGPKLQAIFINCYKFLPASFKTM